MPRFYIHVFRSRNAAYFVGAFPWPCILGMN